MSVLIKGIALPEVYTSAWLTVFECVGEHTFIKTHKISAEQMQAIPPHGRLIDADALKEKQQEDADLFINAYTLMDKSRRDEALNAVANIVNAPTIIEAEEGEPHEQN